MNARQTWTLVIIAALLFGFIYFFERHQPSSRARAEPRQLFHGVTPLEIGSLEVFEGTNSSALAAIRTNTSWFLTSPNYPARSIQVEDFVKQLTSARVYDELPANEVFIQGAGNFGLDPVTARVIVQAGTNRLELEVGSRTSISTNRLYVRVGKGSPVLVTDAGILDLLPRSADVWRDRSLVHLDRSAFDGLQIRSGQRVVELKLEPTNAAWKITRPVPARADQSSVMKILEQLSQTQVAAFVGNAPPMDQLGLHIPSLEVAFLRGTNTVGTLQFGNALSNQQSLVFARIPVYSNIAVVPAQVSAMLNQPYKAFHDARVLDFGMTNISRLESRLNIPGTLTNSEVFLLERGGTNTWTVSSGIGQKYPADKELVARFFNSLSSLQIMDIAREVPAETDLIKLGFTRPLVTYSFYRSETNSAGTLTNVLATELQYGSNQVDSIYMRRTDEVPIYLGLFGEMFNLPKLAIQLKDRLLWQVAPTNITAITLSNVSTQITLQRLENGQWHADPLKNAAIEETVFRLSEPRVVEWGTKGAIRLRTFGLAPPALVCTIEIKEAPARVIQFGNQTLRRDIYATTPIEGESEPVIFEFPGFLYHDILNHLAR